MRRGIAAKAGAIGALTLILGNSLASADTIDVGLIQQIAPRPVIAYEGSYGAYVSSSMVVNPIERTLVSIDLHGLMQAAGINWLESVTILDGGGNQYLGSPGADIDYFQLIGVSPGTTMTMAYTGTNALHLAESSQVLLGRTGSMDAMTGDQDFNAQHFVSLGPGGALTMTFASPAGGSGPDGSGGGGSGPSGPGQWTGGGGGEDPSGGIFHLIQSLPGLALHLNEAGSGERYMIRITGYAIPAPAVAALLALGGLFGRGQGRPRRRAV